MTGMWAWLPYTVQPLSTGSRAGPVTPRRLTDEAGRQSDKAQAPSTPDDQEPSVPQGTFWNPRPLQLCNLMGPCLWALLGFTPRVSALTPFLEL